MRVKILNPGTNLGTFVEKLTRRTNIAFMKWLYYILATKRFTKKTEKEVYVARDCLSELEVKLCVNDIVVLVH